MTSISQSFKNPEACRRRRRGKINSLTLQSRSCLYRLTAFTVHFSWNDLWKYTLTMQYILLQRNKLYNNFIKILLNLSMSVSKTNLFSVILLGLFKFHYPPYRFNIGTRLYGYINCAHTSLVGQPPTM